MTHTALSILLNFKLKQHQQQNVLEIRHFLILYVKQVSSKVKFNLDSFITIIE